MSTLGSIVMGIISLFILYILCKIFISPIKWLFRLILGCIAGVAAMLISNLILSGLGITFSINTLTAMISGVLGIPGMVLTIILQGML